MNTKAQITTEEEPVSFGLANIKASRNIVSFTKETLPDMTIIKKEDDANDVYEPVRFAFPIQVQWLLIWAQYMVKQMRM